MIVIDLPNTAPIITKGLATVIDAPVIDRSVPAPPGAPIYDSFNINDYDCCYTELVLGDLVDTGVFKNDRTSVLFSLALPTDTVEIKLYKDCEEVATLDDDTLGVYYPPSYFPFNLKIGFNLDWREVLSVHGAGRYQIKADRSIISQNDVLESHFYELKPFNEFLANGTVKLFVFSSGYIEGGIDYAELEWQQSIRLRGKFWNPQPTFETDNYQDSTRNTQQIQDEITTDYDLELEPIPVNIAKPLIYDRILGNKILIYDYNLFNFDKYVDFEVYPKEITDAKFFNRSGNGKFTFKFTDKVQNIIKRNFR